MEILSGRIYPLRPMVTYRLLMSTVLTTSLPDLDVLKRAVNREMQSASRDASHVTLFDALGRHFRIVAFQTVQFLT